MLDLDPRSLYQIFLARDRRFDGRVFAAVRSTGIYCRPVCTVRPPKFENCSFHFSPAACEQAGYRPCLRCRPELAPGTVARSSVAPGSVAPVDATARLAGLAVRRIEDGALSKLSLEQLADEFGVTSRHLRRAVSQETGTSPIELATTQRLLLAKQLLTDTSMKVIDVAMSAGFESLRRFNDAFKSRYRLTPSELRRSQPEQLEQSAYSFEISVRPPFSWEFLVKFWSSRLIPHVESIVDNVYYRSVLIGEHRGWISVGPSDKPCTCRLRISSELSSELNSVMARVKNMIDSRADPSEIVRHLGGCSLLKPKLARVPGLRLPGAFDGFECGVRTIVGQQISVKAATTVAGRIADRFGEPTIDFPPSLTRTFPLPSTLATISKRDLMAVGLTARRAETIQQFALSYAENTIRLEPGSDPDRLRESFVELPGIGPWTAEYLLMRATSWPDAFPSSDLGIVKATGLSGKRLIERAEKWRPWRSYATILLWQAGESA